MAYTRLQPNPRTSSILGLVLFALLLPTGCRITAEQAVRRAAAVASWGPGDVIDVRPRKSPLALPSAHWFAKAPEPSPRTEQLLRKFSVLDQYKSDPDKVIAWLQKLAVQSPVMSEIHALAELSQQQGRYALERGNPKRALRFYSIALKHSYQFLFEPKLDVERNAYDPHFRSMCDIYNESLESMLRVVCQDGTMVPGQAMLISDDEYDLEFEVRIQGRWQDERFESFKLVGDYRTRGFKNEYRKYGLGVPLIAVRQQQAADTPVEKYYPPDLTLAMTAFCHFGAANDDHQLLPIGPTPPKKRRAILTLYDPLENPTITAHGKTVPLQSDTTTPLAYHLNDPLLKTGVLATASLLNAETTAKIHGMYMLEPYDPNKIPVVMVHGLWSSPVTWAHMFNDLRANADIHRNYQFWFYSYSTAQPFWVSAMQMRQDLTRIRSELDPAGSAKSLDQMVLVGHSMGGLVSKMQTVESGDQFWNLISHSVLEELDGDPETLGRAKSTFFFEPVPMVKRVVSIATPFGGSTFANGATRWFSHHLFTLPSILTSDFERLVADNEDQFLDPELLTQRTSIDSLAVESPMIKQLQKATTNPAVKYNNVIGRLTKRSVLGKAEAQDSDGVVSVQSASWDDCESQAFVPAEHSHVHQHSACIYEVQRILLSNLVELDRIRDRAIPALPIAARDPMQSMSTTAPTHVAERFSTDAYSTQSSRRR